MDPVWDVIVMGAGLNGLATAWHLNRMGCRRVLVLERFRLGHSRGSSHGRARISRSSYGNRVYVDLMEAARREEWPRLEADAGTVLVHPRDGCFFGPPGGLFDDFISTMAGFGHAVELLPPKRAAGAFPQFRFEGTAGALHDRTAGVIAAADTLSSLEGLCRDRGVEILEETPIVRIERGDPLEVVSATGSQRTLRLVVTAGAWTADLLPFLRPRLKVARQTVGFFRMRGVRSEFKLESFPLWGYLGRDEHDFYYGLPEFQGEGVKVARHVTVEKDDDPDQFPDPDPESVEELVRFIARTFTVEVDSLVGAETCLYTNTANEDFLIDRHPQDDRIVIGAGFSGHGFKFGPLTGRVLAELLLHGNTGVPEFERHRDVFAIREEEDAA